jgi:hypothetical protein
MDIETNLLRQIAQLLDENSIAIGKQELTLSGTAQGLTIPTGSRSALMQVESTELTALCMRFWEDGSTPSSSSGMFRMNGDFLEIITAANLSQFKAINVTGTTKLSITYYK